MLESKSQTTKPKPTRFVPVVDVYNRPLMPTTPTRARHWIESRKATPFWDHGIFCVRLNIQPATTYTQQVVLAIDPGSKKEGLTVKSEAHTFLNIQADAVTHVKGHVETRREMRRGRRFRKTPCRKNKKNRKRGGIPPSTFARWQWKWNLLCWLARRFPICIVVVEDIKVRTKGKRKWDVSFSPLEVGKNWFYNQIRMRFELVLKQGYETKQLRDELKLKKTNKKTAEVFEAHCVDSWVLARSQVGGLPQPDNTTLLLVTPIILHRRQLHRLQPAKGGVRSPYGGTRSHGFKRGSLVKHPKYGVCYVGGTLRDKLSLHAMADGKRLTQQAKPQDCRFLAYNTRRARFLS